MAILEDANDHKAPTSVARPESRHDGPTGPEAPGHGPATTPASSCVGATMGCVFDPQRLSALRATGLLDSAPEPGFDRLTRLAARLLGTPVAAVSLVDERRQFFKSAVGLPEPWASRRETPLSHSFCRHVVDGERPLVVDDAREHPLVRDNPAVPELGVRAYLGVPLRTADGHVLGALCVVDSSVRAWRDEDVRLVSELAESVLTEVELRGALAEARRAEAELRGAFVGARRAEAELARKTAKLEAIFAAMSDAVLITDERGEVVRQNAAAEALFALAPNAAPGAGLAERYGLYREDKVTPLADHEVPAVRALAGERVARCLVFARNRSAPEGRWHSISAVPLPGEGGPRGVVLVGRDVTPQKDAEETLRERESRLRLLADAAFEGIAVSAGGKVIDGNEAFAAMFGYGRDELVGMDATSFAAPTERERVAHALREGITGAYETVGLRKDGTTFPLEVRGRMAPWGGRTVRITAMRDLSERVRAEQARRLHGEILANMAEGVCLVRASDAHILYANATFEALFGYGPGELEGRPVAALNAPDAAATSEGAARDILERLRAERRVQFEVRNARKDGTTFWGRGTASTMDHPEHGEVVVSVQEDVTERRLAEAALARQTAFVGLLRSTATEANAAPGADEALRSCLGRICRHMGWPLGHAYLTTAGTSGPELATAGLWHFDDVVRFRPFCDATRRTRLPAGVGLPGRVLAEGRARWLSDVTGQESFLRRDAARACGLRAGFAFPVLVGHEVAAVLEFYSEHVEEPDAQLLEVMADVGTQLGRVVERERARAAAERRAAAVYEASLTDELTGLRNRRGFHEFAAPLLERADRMGRPALLFFADLNGLKQINDGLGHDAGDEAIRQLGRLLQATFRERDVVARLGGDEFVVFAPDAGLGRAEALQRRLRTIVDAHNAATGEKPFRLSVSVGAAAYDPARPRDLEALLEEADALMYEQKRLQKRMGLNSPPPEAATPPDHACSMQRFGGAR